MLAERTGRLDIYHFLYHATSRFVHFKVKELMRRGWGSDGRFTLSSDHLGEHWRDFSLYWGMYIHVETTLALYELVPDLAASDGDINEDYMQRAIEMIGGRVPLITPTELMWPGKPHPWDP